MPKRTPLRGSLDYEKITMLCEAIGWSALLMRSIIFERSKARYSALQPAASVAAVAVALLSHGPSATDDTLKLPALSAKKPTVFRPPSGVALPGTMRPRPLSAVGSKVSRSGPPLLLDMSAE